MGIPVREEKHSDMETCCSDQISGNSTLVVAEGLKDQLPAGDYGAFTMRGRALLEGEGQEAYTSHFMVFPVLHCGVGLREADRLGDPEWAGLRLALLLLLRLALRLASRLAGGGLLLLLLLRLALLLLLRLTLRLAARLPAGLLLRLRLTLGVRARRRSAGLRSLPRE